MRAAMLKRTRDPMKLYDCAAYARLALAGETGPKRYLSRSWGEGRETKKDGLLRVRPFVCDSSALYGIILDRNLTKPTKPSSVGFQGISR